ncbi:MAG TPA: pyridoxamine 5'-phosphate oxidase family protein [Solirubrobacteraceae bacterium]|nr:pyridoxamine 5'-phosphate oxidase family protein [Solirubrobacteraceae bacterium]
MTELQELDRAQCLRLLAATRFGRVAVSAGAQPPLIRPVNYVFDERTESIVFRSGAGSKLHRLLASRQATFEIDGLDVANRTGWSVIVRGVAQEITDTFEIGRLERSPLDPWAPGEKAHWIRIRARAVTGRWIVEPEASVIAEESVVFRNGPVVPPG